MEKRISDTIRIGSSIATYMVVMRHARNLQAFWGTEKLTGFCAFVENGFSTLTEVAVPYFFLISGFFFFRTSYCHLESYAKMLQKKTYTLLIPFLVWNIIWGVFLYAIGFMDWGESLTHKVLHLVRSDYYGALWYVRNLMLMMVLVPIYGWIFRLKNRWIYACIGVFLLWWWWPVDCAWFSTEGWLFFFLGGMLQQNDSLLEKQMPRWVIATSFVIWFILCFAHPCWGLTMNKICTLLGIVVFWQLMVLLHGRPKEYLMPMVPMTFFIYVNHLWIVKGIKVWIAQYYPQNGIIAFAAYIVLPIITFFLLLFIGRLWNKNHPKSFSIAMGGRT